MDATENKELREQLELKQKENEELKKENGNLRVSLTKMSEELRKASRVIDARQRMGDLLEITALNNKLQKLDKFDTTFMHAVKTEIMYLTNGYDPNGYFKPKKKDQNETESVPAAEEENEGMQTAGLGPGED